ncbi:hypothetical protein HanLR1_Chr00c3006g0864421 [Helianthus annuus]|nr:hypothetical protein HanLR1_Chr00c3006g0864421 [Helianthus annuus]
MLTVKREREIDDGIGKRQSRKLDRQWRKSIVPRPPPSLLSYRKKRQLKKQGICSIGLSSQNVCASCFLIIAITIVVDLDL